MSSLYNNILNLCLHKEIEDSNNFLDILYLEIKICKTQISFLDSNKPKWFQKKKLKEYQEKREDLENKIIHYQKKIGEELELISKMHDF